MLRLPQATPTIDPRGGRPRPTLGAARGAAGHAARRYERVVHLVPAIIGVTAGACHRYWPADGRSRTTDQYPSSTPPSPPAVSQFPYLPLWTPLDGPEAALASASRLPSLARSPSDAPEAHSLHHNKTRTPKNITLDTYLLLANVYVDLSIPI